MLQGAHCDRSGALGFRTEEGPAIEDIDEGTESSGDLEPPFSPQPAQGTSLASAC
jgi:hypothetical protein